MNPSANTIKLALRIADSCARSDIETCCVPVGNGMPPRWDLQSVDGLDRDTVAQAMEYLELRRLVQRDSRNPHIVYFPRVAE